MVVRDAKYPEWRIISVHLMRFETYYILLKEVNYVHKKYETVNACICMAHHALNNRYPSPHYTIVFSIYIVLYIARD